MRAASKESGDGASSYGGPCLSAPVPTPPVASPELRKHRPAPPRGSPARSPHPWSLPAEKGAAQRTPAEGSPQRSPRLLPPLGASEQKSDVSAVLQVFKDFDVNNTGVVDRNVVEQLLLNLGRGTLDKPGVELLMTNFADPTDQSIPYRQFLEWCSIGELAIKQVDTVSLVVRNKDGSKVEALRVPYHDSARQVKRTILNHCLSSLGCDCAPVTCQRLKLCQRDDLAAGKREAQLMDFDVLSVSASALTGEWEVEIELVQPPQLSMLDFACVVAGNEPVEAALALAFCGRSVSAPLLSEEGDVRPGTSESRGTSGTTRQRQEGAQGIPPLVLLPSIRAPRARLLAVARWLLAHGAGDAMEDVAGAVSECLLHCNAEILRELMTTEGFEPLTWEQVVQGVFSASFGFSRSASDDAVALGGGTAATAADGLPAGTPAPLDGEARAALAAQLGAEVAEAQGLLAFVDCLRKELLPGAALPQDLLSRPALLGGGETGKELIVGEAGSVGASLLLAAAHRGQCWALTELTQRGVAWEVAAGSKAKPGGLSVHWLKSAAAALEDHFRAATRTKELRLAILQGDVAGAASALSAGAERVNGVAHAPWSEGPLITALRCGSRLDLTTVLLRGADADPNVGLYEYKGKGSFQLMSPLGWVACCHSSLEEAPGSGFSRSLEIMIQKLVAHPFTDLEFGRVSGEVSRSRCHMETLAHCFRRAELWPGLLALLKEGAAPGVATMGDPRLHASGGHWGEVDRPDPEWRRGHTEFGPVQWLDSLEKQLASHAMGQDRPSNQTKSAARLLEWLRHVRKAEFVFPALQVFPAPFKRVAKILLRHFVQRSGPRRSALPLRALERMLSFVGFWEFPTGRPAYTKELHLRRIDGYSRTFGCVGCPVYDWELLFSGCQLRLGDWAEDAYRARCGPSEPTKSELEPTGSEPPPLAAVDV